MKSTGSCGGPRTSIARTSNGRCKRPARKGQKFELHYGNMTDTGSLSRILAQLRAVRGLQPRGAEPCSHFLRRAGKHGERRRAGRAASPGVDPAIARPRRGSTRRPPRSFSAKWRRSRKARRRPFTRARPMPSPSSTGSGLRRIIGRRTDMHASNGILFNHESPRRGENFVTRKITYSLAQNPRRSPRDACPGQSRFAARLGLRPRLR